MSETLLPYQRRAFNCARHVLHQSDCVDCERERTDWQARHQLAIDQHAAQHYQDAITGAKPKLTAALIRGLKESQ